MKKSRLEDYMCKIKTMDDKEYLFGVILYGIAPTLAGHKPASIITLSRKNRNLYLLWEKYKECFLLGLDLEFFELRKDSEVITVLFYHKEKLRRLIYKETNINFLKQYGYRDSLNLYENLEVLKCRFEKIFPHEIGVFLGFPLEDVICFIKSPEEKCLFCGYWKVYNNPESAKERFLKYDEDKNSIIRYVLQGVSPSLLI